MDKANKIEVAVYLPDYEAQQFLLFREHYDLFVLMLNHGVFDVKNGSVALHFDAHGSITTIQRADLLYNVRAQKLSTVVSEWRM